MKKNCVYKSEDCPICPEQASQQECKCCPTCGTVGVNHCPYCPKEFNKLGQPPAAEGEGSWIKFLGNWKIEFPSPCPINDTQKWELIKGIQKILAEERKRWVETETPKIQREAVNTINEHILKSRQGLMGYFRGEPIDRNMPPEKMIALIDFLIEDNKRLYGKYEKHNCEYEI